MNTIKAIIAILIGTIAFILLISEIEANSLIFFATKFACLAVIAACMRVLRDCKIMDIDE